VQRAAGDQDERDAMMIDVAQRDDVTDADVERAAGTARRSPRRWRASSLDVSPPC